MRTLGRFGTLASVLVCGQAVAAELKVTTLGDVLADDGACSLREAIIAANTNLASGIEDGECPAGGLADTIVLQDGGVYVLSLTSGASDPAYGDLDITTIGNGSTLNAITITVADDANGDGAREATIDAGGATGIRARVLEVQAHASVLLEYITVQGGYLATDDAVTPKQAHGGGIAVTSYVLTYLGTATRATATLELRDCVVRDNIIAYAGRSSGAGIDSAWGGDVTLTRTLVQDNAIEATGSPYQTLQGGGIGGGHDLVIQDSTVSDNRVSGTTGSCLGAGIFGGTRTTITRSTIAANTTGGAGTYSACGSSAGAGFLSNGTSVLFNSTVANNLARGTDAGFAHGGGVSVGTGTKLLMSHVTIAGNTVLAGSAEGGGLYADGTAVVSMQSTLLGDNAAKGGPDCRVTGGNAVMTSYGHNLFEQNDDCGSTDATDVVARDAALGPLEDNGGTQATMALGDGSPAIDGGTCTTFIDWDGTSALDAVIEDQRGAFRPRDGEACDVGAYELVEAEPDCEDGFDEDVDGLTDCDDVDDCAMYPACIEAEVDCGDGFDEDSDGAVDCEDADCVAALECVVPDPVCGDGEATEGEACDDGNTSNEDACLSDCTEASCGDGFVRADVEGCDDANRFDGDGCSALCAMEQPESEAAVSEEAAAETAVTETSVSEQAATETAVSDEAASETTVSDDGATETTVSETTASEETASEETASEETASEETASEETASETTVSEETASEETASETTVSEETVSETTVAEETASEETASEQTPTEATVSEDAATETTVSPEAAIETETTETETSETSNDDLATGAETDLEGRGSGQDAGCGVGTGSGNSPDAGNACAWLCIGLVALWVRHTRRHVAIPPFKRSEMR